MSLAIALNVGMQSDRRRMRAKRVTKAYSSRTARPRVRRRGRGDFLSIAAIELLLIALRPRDWPPHFLGAWIILKCELELADNVAQSIVLKAISAADVAASALAADKRRATDKEVQTLIANYVVKLADIWSQAGLEFSRADFNLNDAFRSKFRRFAELILVAITAPWSLQQELRELPAERQPWKTVQNSDYRWLVKDQYIQAALRQTGTVDTPDNNNCL
jgi:hypothetical protein